MVTLNKEQSNKQRHSLYNEQNLTASSRKRTYLHNFFCLVSQWAFHNKFIQSCKIYATISTITYFVKLHQNLHLIFLLFVLASSELVITNADISHIALSPGIWNLENLKPSPQIFAVCPYSLNLTFQMLTFTTLLYHEAVLLS